MADMFPPEQPTDPQVFPPAPVAVGSGMSDEQTQMTASLAALADQRNSDADTQLQSSINSYKDMLNQGQEPIIRQSMADKKKVAETQDYNDAQSNLLKYGKLNDNENLSDLVLAGNKVAAAPGNPGALEQDGVSQIQETASQDTTQSAIIQSKIGTGVLDQQRDLMAKSAYFNNQLSKVEDELNNEGVAAKIGDFFAIPGQSAYSQEHAVSGVASWAPGANLQESVQKLWALPYDQFSQELPNVIQRIRNNSGLFTENKSVVLQTLQSLRLGSDWKDDLGTNVQTAADALTVLGPGELMKLAKSPAALMMALGNRSANVELAAGDLLKDAARVDPGAGGTLSKVQGPTGALVQALPRNMQVYQRPWIGFSGDILDKMDDLNSSTFGALDQLTSQSGGRLSQDQLQQAAAFKIKQMQHEFADENIVDINDSWGLKSGPVNSDLSNAPGLAHVIEQEHAQDMSDLYNEALQRAGASVKQAQKGEDLFQLGVNPDTNLAEVSVYLGNKYAPGGYITKEAAMDHAMIDRGMSPDAFTVEKNLDGQHFIKVTQTVPENGILAPTLTGGDFPNVNAVSQYLSNSSQIMPQAWNDPKLAAVLHHSNVMSNVVTPLLKQVAKVPKSRRKALAAVLDIGKAQQKWFNPSEFQAHFERIAGRQATDTDMAGYYTMKTINDVDHFARNHVEYIKNARDGYVTGSVGLPTDPDTGFVHIPRTNVKMIENPDFATTRFYDHDEDAIVPAGKASEDLQKRWDSGQYHMMELQSPIEGKGEHIKYVMANKASSEVGPLDYRQLNYVPGGHREYTAKWFVKQAVKGKFADGSGEYYLSPKVHAASILESGAKRYAERMETARGAYVASKAGRLTRDEAATIIERSPVSSYDAFEKLVQSGEIRADTPFEALFDDVQPKEMTGLGNGKVNWANQGEDGTAQYNHSKGRMYYSPKGEHLPDVEGGLAKTIDPMQTSGRALNQAMGLLSFSDYNTQVMEEWSRVAAQEDPLMVSQLGGNKSPWNIFFNGQLSSQLKKDNPELYAKLQYSRLTHKRFLGSQTQDMQVRDQMARRFASYMDGKGKAGDYLASKAYDIMSSNPIQSFRGFIFDLFEGWGNPRNLWMQTQTAVGAIAISPIYGMRATAMAPILGLHMFNRSENLLDFVDKWGSLVHGFRQPGEYKLMVKQLQKSGWQNVGGEVAQLDQYHNAIGGSLIGKAYNTAKTVGRIPFNAGEHVNRIVGWQMAWQQIQDELPHLELTSDAFMNKVMQRADDLTMNMTSATRAAWQQGIMAVPTQFLPYQARVLENMLPKMFGGTSRLSGRQKARYFLGQLALYGTAAVPGATSLYVMAADEYNKSTGKVMGDNEYRMVTKGVQDTMLHYITGADTDIASSAGQGGAWDSFWKKVGNGDLSSPLEMFTGPAGEVAGNLAHVTGQLYQYFRMEQIQSLPPEAWWLMAGDMAKNVAFFSNIQKAYMMHKIGYMTDPKDGSAFLKTDKTDELMTMMGVPLAASTARWDVIANQKETTDFQRNMGQTLNLYRLNAIKAMNDGDTKAQDHWNQLSATTMQLYRDDPAMTRGILQQADKQATYSTVPAWDSLRQRALQNDPSQTLPEGGQ